MCVIVWRVVTIHWGPIPGCNLHGSVISLSSVAFERSIGLGVGRPAKGGKVTSLGVSAELTYEAKN